MDRKSMIMIVGLILALGMGALLLVWLNLNEGSGVVGLLFMFGVFAGIVVVVSAALSKSSD